MKVDILGTEVILTISSKAEVKKLRAALQKPWRDASVEYFSKIDNRLLALRVFHALSKAMAGHQKRKKGRYKYKGATTGRISSRHPNLSNPPKRLETSSFSYEGSKHA